MKNKKQLALILCTALILGVLQITAIAAQSNNTLSNFTKKNNFTQDSFKDIAPSDWFYDDVKNAYQLGLMLGDNASNFRPDGDITVAETITIASRLHAIFTTGKDEFPTTSPWYSAYVDYALKNNIIDSEYSNYSKSATRAEFAVILASSLPKTALEAKNKVADNRIPDVGMNRDYSDAVYLLYRAGIIVGTDSTGKFVPNANIHRSEVAAIVSRMADESLRRSIKLGGEYIVTFNTNGANDNIEEQLIFEGETATQPADPVRGKFDVFEGWYTEQTGGEKFDFSTPIIRDMTLYARWSFDNVKYNMWMILNMTMQNSDPNKPVMPVDPSDADEYYFNNSDVVEVKKAKKSVAVLSES